MLCVPCLNSLHLQGEPEVVERAVLYGVKSCGLTDRGVLLPCWQHNKMKGLEGEKRQWCLRLCGHG